MQFYAACPAGTHINEQNSLLGPGRLFEVKVNLDISFKDRMECQGAFVYSLKRSAD